MREFTEGPWTVTSDPIPPYFRIEAGDPYTHSVGFSFAAIMREPDAQLIAAAPEMYEALFDLLRWIGLLGVVDQESDPINESIVAAQAALAKARGEAPNA